MSTQVSGHRSHVAGRRSTTVVLFYLILISLSLRFFRSPHGLYSITCIVCIRLEKLVAVVVSHKISTSMSPSLPLAPPCSCTGQLERTIQPSKSFNSRGHERNYNFFLYDHPFVRRRFFFRNPEAHFFHKNLYQKIAMTHKLH